MTLDMTPHTTRLDSIALAELQSLPPALLRGGEQVWRGESVNLKPEYLGSAYVKRHSPGRSIALGVVTLGGFTAFMLSTNLFGFGHETPPGGDPDSTSTARLGRP